MVEGFKVLARDIGVLHANQVELSRSESKLDEQFAVSTRLMVKKFNELTTAISMAVNQDLVAPITYEGINEMFAEWEALRSRPDFREHMRVWFTGGDLSQLPPLPAKEEATSGAPEGETPEGAESGEDDAQDNVGNSTATEDGPRGHEEGHEDAVPEVQVPHAAAG